MVPETASDSCPKLLTESDGIPFGQTRNTTASTDVGLSLQRFRLLSPHEHDGHPVKDAYLQAESSDVQKSLSGTSGGVIEDTGDSLQLRDTAAARSLAQAPDSLQHTGTHLLPTDESGWPNSITEDIEVEPPVPLEQLIRGYMMSAAGQDDSRFLPVSELEEIITIPHICGELKRLGLTSNAEWLAHQVWTRVGSSNGKTTTRRKLFAILCLMDQAGEIQKFIDQEIFDCHLPFEFDLSQGRTRTGTLISLFTDWKSCERDNFRSYQGQFLAPYLKLGNDTVTKFRKYDLHRCVVLPFTENEIKESCYIYQAFGGYSVVSRVMIHPAHHDFVTTTGESEKNYFAVKRLLKDETTTQLAERLPDRETRAYERLNPRKHPHIVRLLAIFSHKDHLHMIFPWADGNLQQFWMNHFPDKLHFPRDVRLAVWMTAQFHGLASALVQIHHFYPAFDDACSKDAKQEHGRHGDLKPENILWFKGTHFNPTSGALGSLLVSDLGSTEFHSTHSKTVQLHAAGGCTHTYRAPEFDKMKTVSPRADIWSFGCVLLHFIVWYMYGWEGVQRFMRARQDETNLCYLSDSFFNYDYRSETVEVKSAVTKQCAKIREDKMSSDFILDLLDVVETHMLLPAPEKRASCISIEARFDRIRQNCNSSIMYCLRRTQQAIVGVPTKVTDKAPASFSQEMRAEWVESMVQPLSNMLPSAATTLHNTGTDSERGVTANREQKEHNDNTARDKQRGRARKSRKFRGWVSGVITACFCRELMHEEKG